MKEYKKSALGFKNEITSDSREGKKGTSLRRGTEGYIKMKNGLVANLEEFIKDLRFLRSGDADNPCVDITLAEFAQDVYGFEPDSRGMATEFYKALGIKPNKDTLSYLLSMPDLRGGANWLLPEIITEAVSLGIATNPFNDLIALERTVGRPEVTVPHLNVSDVIPKKMGEAERFQVGTISYGSKKVQFEKIGKGISITDEVVKYTPLDLLAFQLEHIGRWITVADNSYLIEILLNGEQSSGNYAAPVIGVDTTGSIKYKDIKRALIRTANLQNPTNAIIGNEDMTLDIALLDEIVGKGFSGFAPLLDIKSDTTEIIDLKSYSHGLIPVNNLLYVNGKTAVVRLIANALQVEEERIAGRQLTNIYISKTVGLYKANRDSAVLMDHSLAYSANGFPAWMDIEAIQKKTYGDTF